MGIDFKTWIVDAGYPGMGLAIFAETGLLIGFFLPGDTLILTAGFLAQRGQLSLWILAPVFVAAAILGDSTGYFIGDKMGPRLFKKQSGWLFRKEHLERARRFYQRHGGKTIFLARFIGFIRTFAPTVAGAAGMEYARFLLYNVVGGAAWVLSLLFLGYFAGSRVPNLELFVAVLFGGAALLSLIPIAWRFLRRGRHEPESRDRGRVAAVRRTPGEGR